MNYLFTFVTISQRPTYNRRVFNSFFPELSDTNHHASLNKNKAYLHTILLSNAHLPGLNLKFHHSAGSAVNVVRFKAFVTPRVSFNFNGFSKVNERMAAIVLLFLCFPLDNRGFVSFSFKTV